jgi:hypothetical protein
VTSTAATAPKRLALVFVLIAFIAAAAQAQQSTRKKDEE